MPALQDAKTIIDILTNGNADGPKMLRIANAFLSYATDGTDINSSNEAKAQNFLRVVRDTVKAAAKYPAESARRATAESEAIEAGNEIGDDF